MSRHLLLAGAIVMIAAAAWWLTKRPHRAASGTPEDVRVVQGSATASGAEPDASPTATLPSAAVDEALLARIHAAVQDDGATFRDVRHVDRDQAACGEMAAGGGAHYRRFVWLEGPQLLALDDGGADFERLTQVCAGKPLETLAGG